MALYQLKEKIDVVFPFGEDVVFTIAPLSTSGFRKKHALLKSSALRKYRREENIPYEAQQEIMGKSIYNTVLLGWSGVEAPFNEENAVNLLLERPDIADFLVTEANDMDQFIIQQQDELKKK